MHWLSKVKPTTNLFVHFDKNVYANNETVYFTGYLITPAANPIYKHTVMAVAFIRDADSTIVLEDKFIMQNGLSFGSITLPDSILTGNYHFLVYTDRLTNGVPDAVFNQPITLKTNIDPAFKASMKLAEPTTAENKNHNVLVSVTSKDNRFLPKPTTISYQYGNIKKSANTDISGQLLITLPKHNQLTDPNLYLKLKYEKDSSFISMALPQAKSKAAVKFYPEGGSLINGLISTIGWEVKDQQKRPVALTAFLYKNNVIIDTIETSSYGIGKFKLAPHMGADYTVKLIHDGLADSIYHLPKAIEKGLTLSIAQSLVKDTIRIHLKTNLTHHLSIRLHNFRETFLNIPFDMGNNTIAVKIPLTEVPKGLTTITVSDSLDRPLAERIFYAHYDNADKVVLETDNQTYMQREKVNLKIKLDSTQIQGIVSIAVVQDNRLEVQKVNDIESYTYLKNELSLLPIHIKGLPYKDKNYLEQVLLIKGWRRYTWQDFQNLKVSDTLTVTDSLKLTGLVTKAKKELTAPIVLGTYGSESISLINTNNKGFFTLKNEDLLTPPGKKLYLFTNGGKMMTHVIEVNNLYHKTSLNLTKTTVKESPILPSNLQNNAELVLKSNEKLIRLKEVVINNKNDNGFNFLRGANACGDYVCVYNILNCRNHVGDFGNKQPVAGRSYLTNGIMTTYQVCNTKDLNGLYLIDGIHTPKEFYMSDYKEPLEPAFFSTIYWNYGSVLTAGKPTEISFYTSDITGKFRVIVQGITNKDVVYAERFFEVKPKENQ
ncbi:hypothetical protein FA048_12440 [Pedobacter polaris]|uniref:Macroglobulin domain-containing protein n=1 Tax=Pedobacter polaris TaxID=2571273 RepID=A0A4U1CL53_9SPHI|nr:hypothetical protein [Pedobacter polaris]TKC07967.1 hypothetical protein FA048_12440 [Pedobacter polaris]